MTTFRYGALCALTILALAPWRSAAGNDQPADPSATPLDDALHALLQPRTEATGTWELSVGSDYSSGTYGAARATRVYFLPLGISYRSGRWRLAADSGVLRVKGPVDYASILDLTPEDVSNLGLDADDVSVSGAADTALSVAYGIYENFDQLLFVDIGALAKLPTASRTKGLGTGKVAGDLQVDMIKLLGRWSLLGSVSYSFRHQQRGQRHSPAASIGVGRALTDSTSMGAIYEWRGSPDRRARDNRDITAYLSHHISDRVSVTAYGVHSLVSTGAQAQAGVRFTFRWR